MTIALLLLIASLAPAAETLGLPEANQALEEAVYDQDAFGVVKALEAGADANLQVRAESAADSLKPILIFAGFTGNLDLIRTLLLYGAKPDALDNVGESLLHRLVGYCRGQETFLPRSYPTLTLDQRRTVLEILIRAGAKDTASASKRDAGCNYSGRETTRLGQTPLVLAVRTGSLDLVNMVLSIPGTAVDQVVQGRTALMHALLAEKPALEIVQALLKAGASVQSKDANGNNLLHLSGSAGASPELLRYLIQLGVPVEEPNKIGETPLAFAIASKASFETIRTLLDLGAKPDGSSQLEAAPLLRAMSAGRQDVFDELLARGVDVKRVGYLALQAGIDSRSWKLAQSLVDHGASLDEIPTGKPSLMSWVLGRPSAGEETATEAIAFLLRNRASPNADYPLIAAAKKGWRKAVATLLQGGATINLVRASAETAFSAALASQQWAVAQDLAEAGADGNLPSPGICARSAVYGGSLDGLNAVIRAKADLNATDGAYGSPALCLAIRQNWAAGALRLLEAGADPNAAESDQKSALMQALESGLTEVTNALLAHVALDPNRADSNDRTALFFATEPNSLRALIARGAKLNPQEKYSGKTPLFKFTEAERLDLVKPLLLAGADPNLRDEWKRSPVEVARDKRNIQLVLLLCQHGATDDYCSP